ncbi:FecR family protein [Anseongella ginsenosidimutans]|uniref:FecR family protein n=1 Tax=Anseongella ginsenosidimutans TaxID=496056 RepID=A0A4V2UU39_9SPHI|nr:FecR family protein [Anseongella ginsenosidimutans]QEC51613.1 DUF4974 domain-containing protein [Anseongella ginsenosidimutans]TCS88943.1 FecR family protein [Anseongella ginsenosidimutans]
MQEEQNPLNEILQRYLQGKCGPEEEKLVMDWYDSLGAGREPLSLSSEETSALKYRLWLNIRSRAAGLPGTGSGKAGKPFRKWYVYLSGSAAVLLLFFAFFHNRKGTEPFNADNEQAATVPAIYHKTNTSSKTILVVLQDESMVWLKPSGSIRYKDFAGSPRREVTLNGEAYFEVAKKPEKPFLVYSGNVVTRVTGTKFNIKAYEKDKTVEVEVTEGSVEVSRERGRAVSRRVADLALTARQKAIYHTRSRKLEKLSIVSSQLQPVEKISEGLAFEFSDTPLRKVIDLLEEAYPVSIELENKDLESCPLTASLNDETLEIKLELICRSIGATFYKSPDKILISGEGCNP